MLEPSDSEASKQEARRNALFEDDQNNVVKAYSPLNEELGMKDFHYYMQGLDGKTPLWNEMLRKLKPGDHNQITGVIFKDNSVVWSDEAVVHMHLVNVTNRDDSDQVAEFQISYPKSSGLRLQIVSDSEGAISKFRNYLQRNIDPQISLSAFAISRVFYHEKPREIDIRRS